MSDTFEAIRKIASGQKCLTLLGDAFGRRLSQVGGSGAGLFAREFGESLSLADEVVVLDVYGAREDPEPGVGPALITDEVRLPAERVHRAPSWEQTPAAVAALAVDGDTVITMGAGDVTALGPEILRELAGGDRE